MVKIRVYMQRHQRHTRDHPLRHHQVSRQVRKVPSCCISKPKIKSRWSSHRHVSRKVYEGDVRLESCRVFHMLDNPRYAVLSLKSGETNNMGAFFLPPDVSAMQ